MRDAAILLTALIFISWPSSSWALDCIAGETLQVRGRPEVRFSACATKQDSHSSHIRAGVFAREQVQARSSSLNFAFLPSHLSGRLLRPL